MLDVRSGSVGDNTTTMEVDKFATLLIPPDSPLPELQTSEYRAIKTSSDGNCLCRRPAYFCKFEDAPNFSLIIKIRIVKLIYIYHFAI